LHKTYIMAILKTISGIRGTIGGLASDGLSPIDVVRYTASFCSLMLTTDNKKVVIGRDGRISGAMIHALVSQTLVSMGAEVIDLDLSTTPTVEMAVKFHKAAAGIILTASHNPKQWNALKLLNSDGEFINSDQGKAVLDIADAATMQFAEVDHLGKIIADTTMMQKHIDAILAHPLVDVAAITNANFAVVTDAINSTGATFVPALLNALGVQKSVVINGEVNGNFAHNPEPLPEHLVELSKTVQQHSAHLGIAVDPDVDRLCFVNEDGSLFGEEYTLVAIADYVLQHKKGNTVSNLSSTKALRDVTEKHGGQYFAAAVGEVNVVTKMKEVQAVIGGEGNGGVIVPELHYGRDALIGIALFLTHLAKSNLSMTALRASLPNYFISKNKLELDASVNLPALFEKIKSLYSDKEIIDIDGVKIHFENSWVHLRASNTEPIIRIYSEAGTEAEADALAQEVIAKIKAAY
jgi:phosphomannomutase